MVQCFREYKARGHFTRKGMGRGQRWRLGEAVLSPQSSPVAGRRPEIRRVAPGRTDDKKGTRLPAGLSKSQLRLCGEEYSWNTLRRARERKIKENLRTQQTLGFLERIMLEPSHGGIFEVRLGSDVLFRKADERRFPAEGEIGELVAGALG